MTYFSNQSLNYASQLFDSLGNIENWSNLKTEFCLFENFHFASMHLVDTISRSWKKIKASRSVTSAFI